MRSKFAKVGLVAGENTIVYFFLGLFWAYVKIPPWAVLIFLPIFVVIMVLEIFYLPDKLCVKFGGMEQWGDDLVFDYVLRSLLQAYLWFVVGYLLGRVSL